MSESALAIEQLELSVKERRILSLDRCVIPTGELTALMGPNGAGKTTVLRVCLGLQTPTSGRVRVLGREMGALNWRQRARLRQRIGYVPQLPPVTGEMPLTVREVAAIGRTAVAGLCRRLAAADWLLVDFWLERLGLLDRAAQAFHELSGGEQRKVLLARAMVQEPQLLLLDEPTAHLDLGWREQWVALIEQLHRDTGCTIVLVCHELEVLPPACRRVLFLQQGRLTADGPVEAVFTPARVRELYGAGLHVLHQQGRHGVVPGGG